MKPELSDMTAEEITALVRDGRTTPAAVVKSTFAKALEVGADKRGLNAILWSDREGSEDEAERLAGRIQTAEPAGLLSGVPFAAKDNIATTWLRTTCGSRILADYVSPYEATAITRLRAQGAILVAKTNMDEFAMGSSTENSAYGPTLNPHDTTRVPGGSSGGSAALVAAGVVRVALGSETGGSVRQPAAFCGVVGVKPTYGRVSRFGLVAFASSLDQIGVFGANVNDAARCLESIAGFDPHDSTSGDAPVPELTALTTQPAATSEKDAADDQSPAAKARALPAPTDLTGVTIGLPKEYFPPDLDPGIRTLCDKAVELLRGMGASIREVSLPHTHLAIPVYYIIAPAEASSNLARFDGVRFGPRVRSEFGLRGMYEDTRSRGFGREVIRRIMLGTYVLSAGYYDAYYRKAQEVRSLIANDFRSVFATGVDALFTPTTPTTAFRIGAVTDPYAMYLSDIFTATANLAGVPAMSIPIGHVDGLPAGGQLISGHYEEEKMFRVAYALESALGAEAHR